ncbi:PP2C family protein-serine/threonine phosphatase [Actinomadura sp. HBU206391]|uniref:PP2C family protein-serine/threonine phosphatase n=1 Tax=Actinomadura sp. HBU206391 TaxID=2731692 RepID=UPI0016501069|nr:protein phosphatase 2C domain-containing protein [Actinomadura sp. HBU206391]MBC6459569.1 serine/threonine-protein phosphatase [Actinomadura sp. HBU206391]
MNVAIRYTAGSDVGVSRQNNEDSAYAGSFLLAVADGMGGYAGGEVASSTVIESLRSVDAEVPPDRLVDTLGEAVERAHETLRHVIAEHPELDRMGTTLTAVLWSGPYMALAHIGDSRGYLLRAGELFQITEDHTLDQLLEEGAGASRLSNVLFRVLDGRSEGEPDMTPREAKVGDRYLLCSDGLTGVVGPQQIYEVLTSTDDLDEAVRRLIELANQGGGPDNITCVLADVVEGTAEPGPPVIVGAAANHS